MTNSFSNKFFIFNNLHEKKDLQLELAELAKVFFELAKVFVPISKNFANVDFFSSKHQLFYVINFFIT